MQIHQLFYFYDVVSYINIIEVNVVRKLFHTDLIVTKASNNNHSRNIFELLLPTIYYSLIRKDCNFLNHIYLHHNYYRRNNIYTEKS